MSPRSIFLVTWPGPKVRFGWIRHPNQLTVKAWEKAVQAPGRDKSKLSKFSDREFSFHLIFLPEFPKFSFEWFSFRKVIIFESKDIDV